MTHPFVSVGVGARIEAKSIHPNFWPPLPDRGTTLSGVSHQLSATRDQAIRCVGGDGPNMLLFGGQVARRLIAVAPKSQDRPPDPRSIIF